jgi:hypothetical protein
MLRHQHAAVGGGLEPMPRDQLASAVINCQSAVESIRRDVLHRRSTDFYVGIRPTFS